MADRVIALDDADLFGNETAEDEADDIFTSYVLERPELTDFENPARRVCIARAYKGDGKSALLRLASAKVDKTADNPIIVSCSANSIAPTLDAAEFAPWLRGWKAAIFAQIASEVGTRIGAAWSDDAMSLVEEAEKSGFKARNFVSALIDRLTSGQLSSVSPIAKERLGAPNPEKVLARWAKHGARVWLFIDDVDLNVQNTAIQRTKVASFFVACREIVNVVQGLCVRAAVRPNVWTMIKLEFESLSHVEQYASDLSWTEDSIRALLAKRIEAYLRRRNRFESVAAALPERKDERDKALIGLVFESPMQWGQTTRPPHVLVYTLSKHRPRWAIELSKVAAKDAASTGSRRISRDHIVRNLAAFGRRRVEDTIAEFRSQCAEIDELIGAFSRGREQFRTDELLGLIEKRILNHLTPQIVGVPGTPSARDIAAFLFEIGIFFGRREHPDGSYEHITYSEQPSLWRSRTDVDRGLAWEIHPVFRQALEVRDASGREVVGPRRHPRRHRRRPRSSYF